MQTPDQNALASPLLQDAQYQTRRHFLARSAVGLGSLAFGSLLRQEGFGQTAAKTGSGLSPELQKLAPKAKRVLYLHMAGSPSQLDLLDHKPKLAELDGQPISEDVIAGERFAFIKGVPKVLASPYKFAQHGQSGQWMSELLPNLAGMADKLTVVRSMYTSQFNHAPAQLFLNTGNERVGRPSMGSWLTYGLGSENQDLPGFVVLLSGQFSPSGGASLWGSGFLPTVYQGVRFRSRGDAVLYLSNPDGVDRASRRRLLDAVNQLNEQNLEREGDREIQTRIAQYELAYRMQSSVPELLEIDKEAPQTLEDYGVEPGKVAFANNCLLARRMLERGVRFVQLYHWGWDSHGTNPSDDIITSLPKRCQETDQPIAALLRDLERTGLLEETLVVWSGEFGRTPMNEERNGSKFLGRDHHPHAFSIWLAGGGIAQGRSVGATDELGYRPVEKPISVHDLHATLLHQLGINHEELTFRFQGRDFRLTDVHGEVVQELLA